MDIDKLLRFAVENGASDVHIQAGAPPMLRIQGEVRFVETRAVTAEDTHQFAAALAPQRVQERLDAAIVQGLDFAHTIDGLARFRCSFYSQAGTPALVARIIPSKILSIEELHLPQVVHD